MSLAVRVEETGGPEVLRVRDVEPPRPGADQLLVDVAAAGVNYIDTYYRSGVYPHALPCGLGQEGAGRVVATGENVTEFTEGDRVAWCVGEGSYAQRVLVDTRQAIAVPDGLAAETAAAAMLQGLTAHYLVNTTYRIGGGDTVLVHAAAGGAGQLLVQFAKAKGARVIATASTEAKRQLAHAAGADHVLPYEAVPDQVRELTGGEGVAAAYDGVGKATFDGSLASLRPLGTLVLFGAASGQVPPFDLQRLNAGGSLFVTRPSLVHHVATRDTLTWRAREMFDAIASGTVKISIGGRYPLADAATAHRDLEARKTTGKLLLIP